MKMKMIKRNIVTIHQPETLPWMGFFNKMIMADTYVVLDNVSFRKNYFQNRNQILTKNGPTYLTIPVDQKSDVKINEVKIINQNKWQKKHLATILQTYSKSPFFETYKPFIEKLYTSSFERLIDFNMEVIMYVREVLDIKTKLLLASQLDIHGHSTELLLDICQKTDATHYLSGRDGRNYLDEELFDTAGVKVIYQDFELQEYTQFNQNEFHPFMSVLDLLFNCAPENARNLIESGDKLHERI